MATTIKNRILGGSSNNAIQLSSSQFARAVSIPTGWSKIRVGMRIHMTDTGANIGGTQRFGVGFGHGITTIVGDAVCDNWIGMMTNDVSILRTASLYQWDANTLVAAKQVGAALTLGGGLSAGNVWQNYNQAIAGTADMTLLYVDVTKGAPNYSVSAYWHTNVAIGGSTLTTFLNNLVLNSPTVTGYAYSSTVAIAFDELAGALDAIQVVWTEGAAMMEITELAFVTLA